MDTSTYLEQPEKLLYIHKPSLNVRVKSTLIDTFIMIGLMMITSIILNKLSIETTSIKMLLFFIIVLYEPIFIVIDRTVGQRIMGIRVIQFKAYRSNQSYVRIGLIASIIRYIFKVLLGWLSLVIVHSDNYGQAIHDKAGQSLMVYE